MTDFGGKRVLVTGASQRLGAAIAQAFAARGAAVVVHCFRSRKEADALASALPPCPATLEHEVRVCDLADAEAVKSFPSVVGPVDVLVNNAAMWIRGDAPQAELDRQEAVNHLAPCALIRGFAAIRPDGREFAAVNILDAVAIAGSDPSPYATSKRALLRDTRELARELAPEVRVNAVAPGPVFAPRELGDAGMKRTPGTLPLKRPVSPADVADAVVLLASSRSVTGSVLAVDCGQSLLQQP